MSCFKASAEKVRDIKNHNGILLFTVFIDRNVLIIYILKIVIRVQVYLQDFVSMVVRFFQLSPQTTRPRHQFRQSSKQMTADKPTKSVAFLMLIKFFLKYAYLQEDFSHDMCPRQAKLTYLCGGYFPENIFSVNVITTI